MIGQNPIFIPGPTNIPDSLRNAMNVQSTDHRAPDFVELFAPVLEGLKAVFKTKQAKTIIFPSTGTGGWEAAIANTLSKGDKVLIARYGMFSHRWIDLCQRFGLEVEIIECEWGTGAPADLFEQRLKNDKNNEIKALLVTHNETATGVKSDIASVHQALNSANHNALLFVDCVSSLASMDFRMDEWGVDIAISGSQKGLMLNSGLAILAVSEKALAQTKKANLPRTFFSFDDMLNTNKMGGFPYTPPLQLIHGLSAALKLINDEGLENVFKRHFRLAQGVREAVKAWGMELCAKTPELYSDSISAIYVPKGFNSDELTNHAYDKYQVSFGVGLGEMAGKAFRIGHLGALTDVMVLSGLATIEMAMADLNYPIELGAGVSAAQEYYRTSNQLGR